MIRPLLALCLVAALGANEAPSMDAIPAITYAEGTLDETACTIWVSGIGPGSPAEAGQTVIVEAGVADNALAVVKRIDFDAVTGIAAIVLEPVHWASGTTLVYVSATDDAGGITVRTCQVTVTSQPDPPDMQTHFFHVLTGQTVPLSFVEISVFDSDQPPDDSLVITVVQPTPLGDLLNGSTILAAGASFTFADVMAGHLSFRHNGTSTSASDFIHLAVSDGVFAPVPETLTVLFDGYARPVLTIPATTAPWTEGGGPAALFPTAMLSDADTTIFRGQVLSIVTVPAGAASADRLLIPHAGDGAGQIGVAADTVRYQGQEIATWSGGMAGVPLTVSFTTMDASRPAVEAVLRQIAFDHPGQDVPTTPVQIQVALSDGAAGASDTAVATVDMLLVDDPPLVSTAWIGVLAGMPRTVVLGCEDPDSDLFSWSVTAQPAQAQIDLLDAAAGRIAITPRAGFQADDSFTVAVDDGVNPPVDAVIVLRSIGLDDPRPQPLAEAPFEAVAGEVLTVDVGWDQEVAISLTGEVPAGMTLLRSSAVSARLMWTVPVAEPAGLRSFSILADHDPTRSTGRLPVLLHVRARPGGVD
jgi:hypothetical protein